jgi:hypothetical protein
VSTLKEQLNRKASLTRDRISNLSWEAGGTK